MNATELLDRLDQWKGRFGSPGVTGLEQLLSTIATERFGDAASLIRLHETLLFLRAYPPSLKAAKLADAILFAFAKRVAGLQAAGESVDDFEAPEISGIAGTSLAAVFDYEVARTLASRYPRSVEIAWDRYDDSEKLGFGMPRFTPLLDEDWPVEAHAPFRKWVDAMRPAGSSGLAWLLAGVETLPVSERERATLYNSFSVPVLWRIGNLENSRSHLRLPGSKLFLHQEPLLRRSDVSLVRELDGPPLPVKKLPRSEAREILNLILDTSAMRFRELYGFSHPEESGIFRAELGRGVELFFGGVPPSWRLPLRAYHAGMFFKNGVPAGYVELLSLFERAEVGFNLYYTFREGESAWIYARILRLFRQVLGVTCFSVDPYQIGHENPEAVESGAFWFYRKLGFRPSDPSVARLVEREELRMRQTPGYRSSRASLEKLAEGYLLYSSSADEGRRWDRFRVRNVGLAVAREISSRFRGDPDAMRNAAAASLHRTPGVQSSSQLALVLSLFGDLPKWSAAEKAAAVKILRAKEKGSEAEYLRLMQRHPKMRAAFLTLGCE
ncbi:MAG TPA: hypothetical protein VKU19_23355 [Bryobacteraceae bacterium]|nr:hypothetical protein [Bryobacteraceae bacterium]